MQLETQRLIMRPVRAADAEALYRLHIDPLVVNLTFNGTAPTRQQSDDRLALYLREWEVFGFGFFIVFEKARRDTPSFVGRCGLRQFGSGDIELGYCLFGAASGRGLATEAANAVMAHAFDDLCLEKLVAIVRPENVASQRVVSKLGFARKGSTIHHGTKYHYFELTGPDYWAPAERDTRLCVLSR